MTNTVLTTVSMSIGIDLVDGQRNTMLIHPSPTTGASNIRWLGKATEDVWIDFADAIGRTVYQGSVQALQHAQNVAFDLTSLPAGSFIVRMYGDYYDARALW